MSEKAGQTPAKPTHPLRRLRQEKGWLIRELARKARVSFSYVQCIETGRQARISLGAAVKLARALGIDPSEIFDPTEVQTPRNNETHPLRHWREAVGWTLDELAERSGVGRGTIWRIETYYTGFHVNEETAAALANALRINPSILFESVELSRIGRKPRTGRTKRAPSLLQTVRKAQRMSVAKLAEQSGVSRHTIYKLEELQPGVGLLTAQALAQALGVEIGDIFAPDKVNPTGRGPDQKSRGTSPNDSQCPTCFMTTPARLQCQQCNAPLPQGETG